MPIDTILVIAAVLTMFAIFASALIWGQLQSSRATGKEQSPVPQDNAPQQIAPPQVPVLRRRAF